MDKKCSKCKNIKDLSMFYNDISQKSGIRYICKSCDNISTEIWREKNKDKYLARQRKRQHSKSSRKAKQIISQKHRDELSDMYLRSLITKKSKDLKSSDIPDNVVKAWRGSLKLKRELKK